LEDDSASIDDVESLTIPVDFRVEAVTGDTWGVFDNGHSFAD
jgi:hypothetical protein